MAAQVSEGFILLSLNSLKGFTPADLGLLRIELEKLLRDTRSQTPPADDAAANQARNRRIGRLSTAILVVNHKATAKH